MRNSFGTNTISQFDYQNDAIGRRTSVKNSGTAFENLDAFNLYGYNDRSEVTSANRFFGANVSQTNNPVGLQDYAYAYDNIGNRTLVGPDLASAPSVYTANSLNQYTQRTVPGIIDVIGSSATGATITVSAPGGSASGGNNSAVTRNGNYWYKELAVTNIDEAVSQELRITGVKKNAGSNGMDVVSSETGHVFVAKTPELFTYDDDGNLLQDGRFTYSWDAENRLMAAETDTNSVGAASVPRIRLEFSYDYMSRRVSKKVYSWNSDSWLLTSDISFLYDGWNMISETQVSGFSTQVSSYVWGLDLSGTLQGAGGIGGLLSVTTCNLEPVTCYPFCDANGNIADYVDGSGAVVAHREFDPYGNSVVAVGPMANDFSYWFSSKYTDSETRLLYYGFRYYSPSLGRWPSRDWVEDESLYAFLKNSQVNNCDMLGLTKVSLDLKWADYTKFTNWYGGSAVMSHGLAVGGAIRAKEIKEMDWKWEPCTDKGCEGKHRIVYSHETEATYESRIRTTETDNPESAYPLWSIEKVETHERNHYKYFKRYHEDYDNTVKRLAFSCVCPGCKDATASFLSNQLAALRHMKDHDNAQLECNSYPAGGDRDEHCTEARSEMENYTRNRLRAEYWLGRMAKECKK